MDELEESIVDMKKVGEQIAALRRANGLTQNELGERLGVSFQSVSKWENNSAVPELEKLIKMSDVFGVTLDQLVGRRRPI